MAHKKGQGSSRNGRDSNGQRRGVKVYGGQTVQPGSIIVRQCGTRWRPGKGVGLGNDYTIYSLIDGVVTFDQGGRRVNVFEANALLTATCRAQGDGYTAPFFCIPSD